MSIFRMIDRLSTRLRVTERQVAPSASTNLSTVLVDDQTLGVSAQVMHSTTVPTGLDQSTDVGTEWIDNTGAVEWWDGFAWHAGAFPYVNTGDVGVLGPTAVNAGRTTLTLKEASSAPVGPGVGDVWRNAGVNQQWQGSTWVTITDAILNAYIADIPDKTTVTIFLQAPTPTSTAIDDLWFDTTANWAEYINTSGGWLYVPGSADVSTATETAGVFQTASIGLRAILHNNDLDMYNGIDGESPGFVRASVVAGAPRLTISSGAAPGLGGVTEAKIVLDSTGGWIDAGFAEFIAGSLTIANNIHLTNISTTGAGTAAVWLSGDLIKSSSSKRYKKNIRLARLDVDKLLQLKPKRFKFKKEHAHPSQEGMEFVGFIAEDAEALGLEEFVIYEDGKVESFNYPMYTAALQAICQNLNERLKKLEEK